ncbi:MAG: hypothetical protein Q9M16_05435 [Mariprofundus sp.]|nr:hypothetical protein [Mariprofundus sp.]
MCDLRIYCIGLSLSLLCNGGLALASEVIELTQTSCQFIEAENGVDHHYNKKIADDCELLNARTAEQRLIKAQSLHLKAGDYVFRVSNRDVPYALGFWLRGAGLSRFTLPTVAGGGIAMGHSRDYSIRLEAGEYHYSCPLNPTPDYILIVE